MKPNRKAAGPSAMEQKAIELSSLFESAGWKKSVENFTERQFVVAYPDWFTVAGAPPGRSCVSKSCRTADDVIAFLAQVTNEPFEVRAPKPEPTAPPPIPETVIQYRDSPETIAEIERLKAELEVSRSPPPEAAEMPEDKPQQLPPDPESARLSDYGPVGSSVPPEIRELMEEGETIAQAKTRITQLLWVEQAELRQLQGKKGENLKREGEIEFLLGLLARLSD